jgi:peptidoglycan LD-endopeptidase CwlK
MDFKLSRNSKKNIKGIDKRLIKLVNRVLAKSDIDFGIPNYGGFRTAQEQNNLFHKRPKVTQLDGFKRLSYHQSGKAFDIFVYDEHGACWDCTEKYVALSKLFKAEYAMMQEEDIFSQDEKFTWGGDWTRFKDLPHFQIND